MSENDKLLNDITQQEYKYGFVTDIETETIPKGLSEEIVRMISAKKGEPAWMTEYRVNAYKQWLTMTMPRWAHLEIPEIEDEFTVFPVAVILQLIAYYTADGKGLDVDKPRNLAKSVTVE